MRTLTLLIALVISLGMAGCSPRPIPTAARATAPPPGMAIVNIHFDWGNNKLDWSIHNEKAEFLFFLAPRSVHQVVVTPGVHNFFACEKNFGMATLHAAVRVQASAGKIYDVNVATKGAGGCWLRPMRPSDKKYSIMMKRSLELAVVGTADRSLPDNQAREAKMAPRIASELKKIEEMFAKDPSITSEVFMTDADARP